MFQYPLFTIEYLYGCQAVVIHPHSSVNNKHKCLLYFILSLIIVKTLFVVMNLFAGNLFFFCVCERLIIYIIAFPLFFRGGSFDKSLKDIRII